MSVSKKVGLLCMYIGTYEFMVQEFFSLRAASLKNDEKSVTQRCIAAVEPINR